MDRSTLQTPRSWLELKEIIEKGDIDHLGRDANQQKTYFEAMKLVKEEWVSLEDYIFNKVWGFEYIIDENGKKKLKNPVDNTKSNIVFRKNDFPYCLKPEIVHYVIWDMLPLNEKEVRQTIESNCPGLEYLCFMNPPNLRSIRNIHHWHAFVHQTSETKANAQMS